MGPSPALALATVFLAGAGLAGCSSDFWDMNPPLEIALVPALAGDLFIDVVEVRSSFYNPPDAFSEAFVPAFRKGAAPCFTGTRPVRAIVFIHALDRDGTLLNAEGRVRLPGWVDLHDARGQVIGRYQVRVDLAATDDDLEARRTVAAEAFGAAVCAQA